jgi:hypothetical protein
MNDFAGTLNTVPNVVGGFAAGKNKIINGDFNIWQRGTSFTTAGGNNYSADRMIYNAALTPTVSRQSFTAGDISGYNPQFFLRFVKGNATADSLSVTQKIEDVRTFAGQTVTLSFWAKGSVAFTNSPLTRQMFGSGGSADVYTTYTSQSITTSWARYSMTFTVPSVVGKTIGAGSFVDMYFIRYTGSPDITVDVWGVQLEAGSIATPFQTATGTIQGELAACKRYLPSVTSYDNVIGYSYVTNNALYYFAFDVQARVAPTGVTATSASAFALNTPTTVTPTFQSAGVNGGSLNAAFTITAGQGSRIGGGSILFTGCEL